MKGSILSRVELGSTLGLSTRIDIFYYISTTINSDIKNYILSSTENRDDQ